jgi:hypothetical protein
VLDVDRSSARFAGHLRRSTSVRWGWPLALPPPLLSSRVTVFHVVAMPPGAPNLRLLAQYFYGYDVTWRGAFIGAWWSFVAAFVAGWFVAFVHNFVVATRLFLLRAKADLTRTTDVLDHI